MVDTKPGWKAKEGMRGRLVAQWLRLEIRWVERLLVGLRGVRRSNAEGGLCKSQERSLLILVYCQVFFPQVGSIP